MQTKKNLYTQYNKRPHKIRNRFDNTILTCEVIMMSKRNILSTD